MRIWPDRAVPLHRRVASLGAVEGPGQVSVKLAGAVRSGDSGGGVFDAQGRLVAVVWGESGGVTYASTGGTAAQVSGTRSRPSAHPRDAGGAAPIARAVRRRSSAAADPIGGCTCGCGAKLRRDHRPHRRRSRPASKIAATISPQAILAPYARTDQLAIVDKQNRERHQSLAERFEAIAPLVGAAGRAAIPIATTALGISGPVGWGILAATTVASWAIGRHVKRRDRTTLGGRFRECKHGAHVALRSPPRRRPPQRSAPFALPPQASNSDSPSSATIVKLANFYDFRSSRDVIRYKTRLQDGLHSTGSTRLPTATLIRSTRAWADDLRRELRERFNEIAPTKFELSTSEMNRTRPASDWSLKRPVQRGPLSTSPFP